VRGPERFFPILAWLRRYDIDDVRGDLAAGATTAVMLVPQGMAYATVAGLPPVVGLYASTVPLLAYALLGSSRHLAVGPVAIDSLLVFAAVGSVAQPGSEGFVAYAALLAAMVGGLQVLMAVGGLGFLANFLSRPVVVGFASAAAVIIAVNQLGALLGFELPRGEGFLGVVVAAVRGFGNVHGPTVGVGAGTVVFLVLLRLWKPRAPRALFAVMLGLLLAWVLDLAREGVRVVGDIPAGLPSMSLPVFAPVVMGQLFPSAVAIALVGFTEAMSVGRTFAARHRYRIGAGRELLGIGVANLAAGFFQGYPVTGGFARSAVNEQAGARTGVAGVVTAGLVASTLLLFTTALAHLPSAVLAAIIIVAVLQLVDVREAARLWRVKKGDLALLALTFVATLALGILAGIGIGIAASLIWFVVRSTRPHFAVLGRLPGTEIYRNVKRYPQVKTFPGLLILRVDAEFYFGNVTFLEDTLRDLEERSDAPLRAVVLDASSIDQLDSSAEAALRQVHADYREREIQLYFSGVKGPVRDVMASSGLYDCVGRGNFFFRNEDAVSYALKLLTDPDLEDDATLRSIPREPP
jgi:SulP family sulfate permease